MSPSWWYKKPSYVDIKQFAAALQEKAEKVTGSPRPSLDGRRQSSEVPTKLGLERILNNQTCSPMSLHDFYMYLKHIEYSSENLEFYLWFLEYEAAYIASTYPSSGATALQWGAAPCTKARSTISEDSDESQDRILDVEKGEPNVRVVALPNPSPNPKAPCSASREDLNRASIISFSFASIFRSKVVESLTTDDDGPLNMATKLVEARRKELKNIAALFLVPGAPNELNIPASMRKKCLEAIATSSSPHHLKPVADHCYLLLRSCSHRNFVRLGVSNGTFETICMATGLGIVLTIAGFLCMLLLAFASPGFRESSRWRGLAAWPIWTIGIGLILSGLRGSCFFLLLFSRRQPLPWETVSDETSVIESPKKSPLVRFLSKLMIFDRKVKVKDDNLKKLQHKIVIQSILGGVLFATMMEIFFLSLPIWKDL